MTIAELLTTGRGSRDDHAGQAVRDMRVWFTRSAGLAAREQLRPLLETARSVDPGDPEAVADLRERARTTTARLVAAGHLPPWAIISPQDPGVVVIRTLTVAWRRVTPSPD